MKTLFAVLCAMLMLVSSASAQCSGGSCGTTSMGSYGGYTGMMNFGGMQSQVLSPGAYTGWGYQNGVSYVPSINAMRVESPAGGFNMRAGYSYPRGAVNSTAYPSKPVAAPVVTGAPVSPLNFHMVGGYMHPHCLTPNFSYNPNWQKNNY